MADALLELRDVRASYGEAVVLDGVSIALAANGSLAVLGRNGVGKTTLLLTMMGFVRLARGSVWFAGTSRGCRRTGVPSSASAGCRRSVKSSLRSPWRRTLLWPPGPVAGTQLRSTACFRG